MTLKVTFELSNQDLRHFRAIMRAARDTTQDKPEDVIIGSAEALLASVGDTAVPDFVAVRLQMLGQLIRMLGDEEWQIPGRERRRVLNALAYFCEPEDLIPDLTPGLGFLDDAIMIELVGRELRHELDAYEDFCRYRQGLGEGVGDSPATMTREHRLAARRRGLHERMRRRAAGRRRSARDTGHKFLGLF